MMDRLPISKSLFAPDALSLLIEREYGLVGVRTQLLTASMRDVYLVTSDRQRNILFVYRHGARTADEIRAEWAFVEHLAASGVPVAPALRTIHNQLVLELPAPEGLRYGVLATFIPGRHLRQRSSLPAVTTYGRLIATIHTLADRFALPFYRPENDVLAIVDQPAAACAAAVHDRPEAVRYVQACAATLHSRLASLSKAPPAYDLIHGDVIRANAQVSDDGAVSILDFDLCGPGWRTYDIASYLFVVKGTPNEATYAEAFLRGYQSVRPLTEAERATLPLFEATRAIFDLGVPAMEVNHWGRAYLDTFLDQSLAQLKRCMEALE
jgi:Ser/Thr protein kinase RdoA (MazF antagonist)